MSPFEGDEPIGVNATVDRVVGVETTGLLVAWGEVAFGTGDHQHPSLLHRPLALPEDVINEGGIGDHQRSSVCLTSPALGTQKLGPSGAEHGHLVSVMSVTLDGGEVEKQTAVKTQDIERVGGDMTPLANAPGAGVPIGLVAIACGLAIGIAGLSAIGQGISSAGGMGATAEKPEMFGRGILFSVLPETQAIYGLLVAILLMAFSGMFAKEFSVTLNQSIASIGAGLAIGIAGLSAIGQGITGSAAAAATARNPDAMGKGLIFSVMSETFAIFGLLVAILIMRYTGLM